MEQKEFCGYVGNDEQVYGVRSVTLNEGNAKGISIYQVTTAGGLEFDILPDSGLDIGRLFQGRERQLPHKERLRLSVKIPPVSRAVRALFSRRNALHLRSTVGRP